MVGDEAVYMQKYRIAIQTVDGGNYKHKHNIMFMTDDISKVIKKIRKSIDDEIEKNMINFNKFAYNKHKKSNLKEIIRSDKFDRHAVGKDIKYDEYIENEQFFALHD